MKKSTMAIAAVLVVAIVVIFGAVAVMSTGEKKKETPSKTIDTLVIGTTESVTGIAVGSGLDSFRTYMMTESLIRMNSTGAYVPALAESWETTDSQNWTFHIRTNATWHDGVKVTAYDLKFSLEYLPAKLGGSNWAVIKSVDAVDNSTLVIHLKYPKASLMVNLIQLRTVPKHIFENINDPRSYTDVNCTIGCGPYVFDKFDEDAGLLSFKAFDNYYGGKPSASKIQFKLFSSQASMIMALFKGDIDTIWVYSGGMNYYYMPQLLEHEDMSFMRIQNPGVPNVLWFNTNSTAFASSGLREAISYALDYTELCNLFTLGYGSTPYAGFLPDVSFNFKETRSLSLNFTKANSMLTTLGYVDADSDGMREAPGGAEFQPEIKMKNDVDSVRLGELIKKYFNAVGIDVKIKNLDSNSFWDYVDNGNYEMFITRTTPWGMIMDSGYATGYLDARPGRGNGWTVMLDPDFQAIADELLYTTNETRIQQLAYGLQDFYSTELPIIALYYNDYIQPYNVKYEGYVASPISGILSYETYFGLYVAGTV